MTECCDQCSSTRLMSIDAKCSDCCCMRFGNHSTCDYAPYDVGVGGGDYLTFEVCLQCGKIQGDFPVEDPSFEDEEEDLEDEEDYLQPDEDEDY